MSFGLPKRKLINEVFLRLALDYGVDSGIINPVETKVRRGHGTRHGVTADKMTLDLLRGEDDFCMNFIGAYRSGQLG